MTLDDERLARLCFMSTGSVGPSRMRWLSDGRTLAEAWDRFVAGHRPTTPGPKVDEKVWVTMVTEARALDVDALVDAFERSGGSMVLPDDAAWWFADDPEPPATVLVGGRLELVGRRPAVAIVGTRRPTQLGRAVAHDLGAELASVGVTIVSGLALGIDVAAHRGALGVGGDTVAVVATGLDRPYPKQHRDEWATLLERGAIVSETGFGLGPQRWRFPARNRLIAALADLVIVVESQHRGGALSTAAEALERGIAVAAVPGSVRSPASDGTNALLVDGAIPIRHADDVCALLDLELGSNLVAARRPTLDELDAEVAGGGCSLDVIVALHGGDTAAALAEVEARVSSGRWTRSGAKLQLGAGRR